MAVHPSPVKPVMDEIQEHVCLIFGAARRHTCGDPALPLVPARRAE